MDEEVACKEILRFINGGVIYRSGKILTSCIKWFNGVNGT